MSAVKKHSVLSVINLCIGYSEPLLNPINIELKEGELTGLVGINGSGKSTLLRTLSGLQQGLQGSIQIANAALDQLSSQELAQQLAVVLTQQPISGNLTVQELVALGRQPYTNWLGTISNKDTIAIQEALEATDIIELQNRKCSELSDGQLQRVLIARAVAQNTPIILLDEPLTHLDLHHKAAILKLLKALCTAQHKTIVFSTHDIQYAIPVCDKMMVLNEEKYHYATVDQLIKEKVFESLFPSQHITFDAKNKQFRIDTSS